MIDLTSLSDNALVDWSKNFAVKIGEYASLFGISTVDEHHINEDAATTSTLVDTTNQAKETRTAPSLMDELVGYKNTILHGPGEQLRKAFPAVFAGLGTRAAAGILPRVMGLVDKVKKNPGLTPAIAQSLGIDEATVQKLKGGEQEMLGWLNTFVDKLKDHRSELGLHETEVQAANSDVNALQHVVEQTDKEQKAAPNHPQLPNLLKYKELDREWSEQRPDQSISCHCAGNVGGGTGHRSAFHGFCPADSAQWEIERHHWQLPGDQRAQGRAGTCHAAGG